MLSVILRAGWCQLDAFFLFFTAAVFEPQVIWVKVNIPPVPVNVRSL